MGFFHRHSLFGFYIQRVTIPAGSAFLGVLLFINAGALYAAYAPPANYILPDYQIERIESGRLILNTGDRLRVDDWDSWPNPLYVQDDSFPENLCNVKNDHEFKTFDCGTEYLVRIRIDGSAYDDCQKTGSAELVFLRTGRPIKLGTELSQCDEVNDIQYYRGQVWVLSALQGDHGVYSGKGLWRIDPDSGRVDSITSAYSAWRDEWGHDVIYSFAFDENNNTIWLTSRNGLHRYDIDRREWESRYYHIYVDADEHFRSGLKKTPQPDDEIEMYSHLMNLHIQDKAEFIAAWKKSGQLSGQPPYVNEHLAPFYLGAIQNMPETTAGDYQFSTLVTLLIKFDRQKYLPIFEEMVESLDSPDRRASLIQDLERYGYSVPDETLSRVHTDFLDRLNAGKAGVHELCGFYRSRKLGFTDIDPEMLNRSAGHLSEVLLFCFDDLESEPVTEKRFQHFYQLYILSDNETRASLCRYLHRVKHFELDHRFIRNIVMDLSQLDPRQRKLRGPLQSLLLDKIRHDDQAVYLARLPESEPAVGNTVRELIYLLERRRTFPGLDQYRQQKRAEQAAKCVHSYQDESVSAFKERCRGKIRTFKPMQEGVLMLPSPGDSDAPVFIDQSH